VHRKIEEYVRGLGLDAYAVGGAVRDELLGLEPKETDFLVPGVDHASLRTALEPHGRVEDLEVAGQLVGIRLYPREREIRAIASAGIELAPPRAERSTGPGRHEFVIVADPSIPVEEDMRRRDFTVNAMARRLETGEIVDPFGGRSDLERRILRTVTPRSFAEDPLRLVRGLRFVSQLDLDPDEQTLAQMRAEAPSVKLVSGERIGGGLRDDGLGELSKLLLGPHPAKALRIARDTGVLAELIPELDRVELEVVQRAADAGVSLPVRLAALLRDEPVAGPVLRRLRYPTQLRDHVIRLCRARGVSVDGPVDELFARRFLREHGDRLAFDLLDLKRAEDADIERLRALLERERSSPHHIRDLAVDGSDLIGLGFREGPALGRALETLLDEVVENPQLNKPDVLSRRAKELLEEAR
jgi:tRNA nucleotidyltransferase (CCA-adding enzyme)